MTRLRVSASKLAAFRLLQDDDAAPWMTPERYLADLAGKPDLAGKNRMAAGSTVHLALERLLLATATTGDRVEYTEDDLSFHLTICDRLQTVASLVRPTTGPAITEAPFAADWQVPGYGEVCFSAIADAVFCGKNGLTVLDWKTTSARPQTGRYTDSAQGNLLRALTGAECVGFVQVGIRINGSEITLQPSPPAFDMMDCRHPLEHDKHECVSLAAEMLAFAERNDLLEVFDYERDRHRYEAVL